MTSFSGKYRKTVSNNSQDPLAVYIRALGLTDIDSLHEVVAKHGVAVLQKGLPYVVLAARLEMLSSARTNSRRRDIREKNRRELSTASGWDPYEQTAQSEVLRAITNALAELPYGDVLTIWRNAEGYSDREIVEEWKRIGLRPEKPTPAAIRKRRERAIVRLREMVIEQLGLNR